MTDDALDECVRRLVAQAPPLTPAQRDQLAVLLRPLADTPGPRAPRPVASARSSSRRFSGGSRATRTAPAPQEPTQPAPAPLTRPGFGAIPRRPA